MRQIATPYQNAKINQAIQVLFVWSKKWAVSSNWITKFEIKFTEKEKKINSLENSCNKMKVIKAGN